MSVYDQHLQVLTERRNWLRERIEAKRRVGWEIQWDEREFAALEWVVGYLNGETDDG